MNGLWGESRAASRATPASFRVLRYFRVETCAGVNRALIRRLNVDEVRLVQEDKHPLLYDIYHV